MTWNFASLNYSCRCMGFWIFLFLVYWDFKSNQGERTAMFPASSVKGWFFLGQRWCCCMCSCHRLQRHRSFCLQTHRVILALYWDPCFLAGVLLGNWFWLWSAVIFCSKACVCIDLQDFTFIQAKTGQNGYYVICSQRFETFSETF